MQEKPIVKKVCQNKTSGQKFIYLPVDSPLQKDELVLLISMDTILSQRIKEVLQDAK